MGQNLKKNNQAAFGPNLKILMSWTEEFPRQNKYQDMGRHFGEIKTCDFQYTLQSNVNQIKIDPSVG